MGKSKKSVERESDVDLDLESAMNSNDVREGGVEEEEEEGDEAGDVYVLEKKKKNDDDNGVKKAAKAPTPPKPPRPPRSPSLDAADQKLIREIAQLAMLKRSRIQRIKALKKMKATKPTTSSPNSGSTNLFATIITILFCLIILFQGTCSGGKSSANFQGSPESAVKMRGGLISVQQYNKNSLSTKFHGPGSESPNVVEQVSGLDTEGGGIRKGTVNKAKQDHSY